MEALPEALKRAGVTRRNEDGVISQFILDIAFSAVRRDDRTVAVGIYRTVLLSLGEWNHERLGAEVGAFVRQVLDLRPPWVAEMIELVEQLVKDERVLELLQPYRCAVEFLKTNDVGVLEKLFPEVRELVMDIVKRVSAGAVAEDGRNRPEPQPTASS